MSAGAAEAALDFVGDERGVMLRGKCAGALPERVADGENPAFSLNRFDHERADGIIEFGFEVRDVIEAHELDARDERAEWLAVF